MNRLTVIRSNPFKKPNLVIRLHQMIRPASLPCTSTRPLSLCHDAVTANHRRNFYQMRIDRIRNAEAARRNRQRLQDPSFFPSVPTGGI